jgi:sugar phosphate permease
VEEAKLRWRIAILTSAAIAISYLDRQTLPVAVKAISRDIPLTNAQFSTLQSPFLFAYALVYVGGGKLVDVLGTRLGLTRDHALLVACLCQPCARNRVRDVGYQQVSARGGRRRRLPCC